MNKKLLVRELGIGMKPGGKMPPAFLPKLRVRVGCDRTRQVTEFLVDLPLEGFSGEAWEQCQLKMHAVFEAMGLLKQRPKLEAKVNAEEETARAATPGDKSDAAPEVG